MSAKFAFAGFRHPHIVDLYQLARDHPDIEIVAACEEDAEARRATADGGIVRITHSSFDAMLAETDCDVVAVGDVFARRGSMLIAALRTGRHVIADKPVCTRLEELDQMTALAADQSLAIGCILDMRDGGVFRQMADIIRSGEIGEVAAVSFGAQHPLNYGSRPAWYFEPGQHGGTLNDIAVHAVDYIRWASGLEFASINAARNWNAALPQAPDFRNAAQVMLTLNNGGGVLGDVSYLSPDGFGYEFPHYWRVTFWGRDGVLETALNESEVVLYHRDASEARRIPAAENRTGGYLEDFLREINDGPARDSLCTTDVLLASRITLRVQEAADQSLANVKL